MAAADGAMTGRPGVASSRAARAPPMPRSGCTWRCRIRCRWCCSSATSTGRCATAKASRKSICRRCSPRSPNGRRGSTIRRACPNMSRAPLPPRFPDAPARWCWPCPRTCCSKPCRAPRRPSVRHRPAQAACPDAILAMCRLIGDAAAPVAIVGGAGWNAKARALLQRIRRAHRPARRLRLPPPGRDCQFEPGLGGQLGYGPNPKLVERIRGADLLLVVGTRLGEATSEGYTLVTPDHPGQILIHVHPDPEELGRVYRADLAICADMARICRAGRAAGRRHRARSMPAARRIANGANGRRPQPSGARLDLGLCVAAMREALPADTIICNGAGNFSSWWHRYWRLRGVPVAAGAHRRGDGLRRSRRRRRRAPLSRAHGGGARGRRRFPDERAGTGDRGAIWLRHARAGGRQFQLRHHPHASGARLSRPRFGHHPRQPGFRRAGPGLWRLGGDGCGRPRSSPRPWPRRSGARACACSTS